MLRSQHGKERKKILSHDLEASAGKATSPGLERRPIA